jgi:hypothetical protein
LTEILPARRTALAVFACIGCLAGTALTTAHAEEPGFGGLFQRLFSPTPPPAEQAAPVQAQAPSAPAAGSYAQRRSQRAEASRPRPRIRYVALPKDEPLKLRVSDRQTPLDMKAGPVAAFLRDDTLKPGDIVVLKGGARVFTGQPGRKHSLRDFEPVQASGLLDKRTRVQLGAMIQPTGARPSDGTRSMKARLRAVPAPIAAPAAPQMESAAVRVIYRTNFTR